jgi:hypothetical protein
MHAICISIRFTPAENLHCKPQLPEGVQQLLFHILSYHKAKGGGPAAMAHSVAAACTAAALPGQMLIWR